MTNEGDSTVSDGDDAEDEESDLMAFLQKRGAVELLATVDIEGVRYNEMEESFGISHDTLSKHLAWAEELELIETETVRGERGRSHKYVLTPLGARIHLQLERMGAVNNYQLLQMYRRFTAEDEEEILEWVEETEEEGDLYNHRRNVASFQMLKGVFGPDSTDTADEE